MPALYDPSIERNGKPGAKVLLKSTPNLRRESAKYSVNRFLLDIAMRATCGQPLPWLRHIPTRLMVVVSLASQRHADRCLSEAGLPPDMYILGNTRDITHEGRVRNEKWDLYWPQITARLARRSDTPARPPPCPPLDLPGRRRQPNHVDS